MGDDLMAKIILVRHGQTEWNRIERYRGRADVPLNAAGLAQAEATGEHVAARWAVAAVYSSPLSRAVQTGEAVAKHFDLAVQPHPDLVDIDYGAWQGFTPEEVRQRWPELSDTWYHRPHMVRFPEGETLDELRSRAMRTVSSLTDLHYSDTIVLVGHTVINRVILLGILGLGNERFWHLRQDNCAINVIEKDQEGFTLVVMNDTCHLDAIQKNGSKET